jgi:hypothetical protein
MRTMVLLVWVLMAAWPASAYANDRIKSASAGLLAPVKRHATRKVAKRSDSNATTVRLMIQGIAY